MTRSLCVYCGSSPGNNPAHMALATALGKELAASQIRLVYGGGGLGLMGATTRATHEGGGDVLGIIPNFLQEAERTYTDVKHVFVEDMHQRKIMMFDESDGFIVLPGGIGTLEEVVEVLSWLRLNLHEKPVVFLSDTGFWDDFLRVFEQIVAAGFAPKSALDDMLSATSPQQAIAMVEDRIANPLKRKPLGFEGGVRELS
ncbi:TIGR00730 family Rossman fold protein [Litorimonas sp. RW-G-Af-16]|uniref:LOG family protein n=1 Tax=Litorimonas sp. RW-G-Af-16 TaxID=3241168 RepID=UPI003AB0EFFB